MTTNSEVSVTFSSEMLDHLRVQAQRLHVPLKWLVASLVLDTTETAARRRKASERSALLHRSVAHAV